MSFLGRHSQAELGSVSQQLPELLSVNILPLLALNGRYRAPPSKPILTITIPPFPIISSPESAVPAAPSGVEKGTIPFPEFAVPAAPGGVGNWLMVDDLRPSRPLTRRRPRPKSDPSLGAAYRDQSPAATLRRGAGVQENPDSHR
ncbi:hypothetical protein JAAARDRAFT_37581 [Jaapia argillacea MUCL 33604]|uniref:Uncharacterized protein n=1 Tax=Jaapia argillacea MUCL 33604 TaxID=933084 RepID=A0A067PXH4_9AGAM|nr:hypothetical protein JAAARDRAFT_37581 [Jaapia argillacea MUCL 33604]